MAAWGGQLKAHNHSSSPGDGGTLSLPVSVSGQPTGAGQIATVDFATAIAFLWSL